jgi:hypothetical protein
MAATSVAMQSPTSTMRCEDESAAIINHFFETGSEPRSFWCRVCRSASSHKAHPYEAKNGRTNLMNHLRTHKKWEEDWNIEKERRLSDSTSRNKLSFISELSEKAKTIFGWLDLVINNNMPLNIIENNVFKRYTNLQPISMKTLLHYMEMINESVILILREECADISRFGLVFDGWDDGQGGHIVAVFISFMRGESVRTVLLSCSPLDDRTKRDRFAHIDYLTSVLLQFGLNIEDTDFIVADNTNLNPAIAREIG